MVIARLCCLVTLFLVPLETFSRDFGDPRGFLAGETVTETPLYPGVRWYRVDGHHQGLPQVTHVVKVAVSEPHLTMKSLVGERYVNAGTGQFFRRSLVSQMQADNDSLVAINTAFFDIGSTMAPNGLVMSDKNMLREPQVGRPNFLFTESKDPLIGLFGYVCTLQYNGSRRSFSGMNRGNLPADGVAVYQQPWDRSPGTSAAFTSGYQITEVLVEKTALIPSVNEGAPTRMQGRILQVRENQPSVSISADQFVITAAGRSRAFFQAMTVGATVEVEWRLTGGGPGMDWTTITQSSPGGSLLVVDGQVQSQDNGHWNTRHPRSAIGISADRSEVVLVLIEGRQDGRAEGMSLHTLGQYLQYMGAYNGLEFDGGGSSSLAARVHGTNMRLNTPSDGSERYVPASLGVQIVDEPQHGLFRNIRVASGGTDAVISWETAVPAVSYAKFGQADLDRLSAREPVARKRHTASLSGLASPGGYYARLVGEVSGNTYESQIVEIPGQEAVEVILDNTDASFIGSWSTGSYSTPWGSNYRYADTVTGNPTHSATFSPDLPVSGLYDVYTWYTQGGNRPVDARYQILHANGVSTILVNQQVNGAQWRRLASNLRFEVGATQFVRLLNHSSEGGKAVIADAARWVLRKRDEVDAEVPTWWLEHFFGDETPDLAVDADGDGLTIAEEYRWGTDPADPGAHPRYRLEEMNDSLAFTFSPFHEGHTYRLKRTVDLTDGNWEDAGALTPTRLETGEGRFVVPGVDGEPRTFYRLEVER